MAANGHAVGASVGGACLSAQLLQQIKDQSLDLILVPLSAMFLFDVTTQT